MTRYTITVHRTEDGEPLPNLRLMTPKEDVFDRMWEVVHEAKTEDMTKLRAALHKSFDIALDHVGPPNG